LRLLGGKLARGNYADDEGNRVQAPNNRKFFSPLPQSEVATMPPSAVAVGVLTPIIENATTGGYHIFSIPSAIKNHTFYIRGNGPVSAGAIQIRTASSPGYTGTFAPYGNPISIVSDSERVVNIPSALFHAVRVEVSGILVGGTVTVYYKGD